MLSNPVHPSPQTPEVEEQTPGGSRLEITRKAAIDQLGTHPPSNLLHVVLRVGGDKLAAQDGHFGIHAHKHSTVAGVGLQRRGHVVDGPLVFFPQLFAQLHCEPLLHCSDVGCGGAAEGVVVLDLSFSRSEQKQCPVRALVDGDKDVGGVKEGFFANFGSCCPAGDGAGSFLSQGGVEEAIEGVVGWRRRADGFLGGRRLQRFVGLKTVGYGHEEVGVDDFVVEPGGEVVAFMGEDCAKVVSGKLESRELSKYCASICCLHELGDFLFPA
jgi:hypothetical protein